MTPSARMSRASDQWPVISKQFLMGLLPTRKL
jgi:hypothetical protein